MESLARSRRGQGASRPKPSSSPPTLPLPPLYHAPPGSSRRGAVGQGFLPPRTPSRFTIAPARVGAASASRDTRQTATLSGAAAAGGALTARTAWAASSQIGRAAGRGREEIS